MFNWHPPKNEKHTRMKSTLTTLTTACLLALTAMTAHSALVLTFTESGGDVVLTYSGSVDMTNATFSGDAGFNRAGAGNEVLQNGVDYNPQGLSGVVGADFYSGVDLLAGNLTNATFSGTPDAGNSGQVFTINNASFTIAPDGGITPIANNDLPDVGVYAPSGFITFSGQTFASMGLDAHAQDVLISLWGAQVGAANSELVQFMVSSVPEPSGLALFGLGSFMLILRRGRA